MNRLIIIRCIALVAALSTAGCFAQQGGKDDSEELDLSDDRGASAGSEGLGSVLHGDQRVRRGNSDPAEERMGPFPDPWQSRMGPFPDPWQAQPSDDGSDNSDNTKP